MAVVPHGPFLLDRLTAASRKTRRAGRRCWRSAASPTTTCPPPPPSWRRAALAGDALKWAAAARHGEGTRAGDRPGRPRRGCGWRARPGAPPLLAELPKADVAHLATHGFFADPQFRSVLQLDPKLFEPRPGRRADRGRAARSPLVLSGLVLAGANLPDTPGRRHPHRRGASSACDLRRTGAGRAVACETGLGEMGRRRGRLRPAARLPPRRLPQRGRRPVEGGRRGHRGA